MLKKLKKVICHQQEYKELITQIRSHKLPCSNMIDVEGDYRFWNVDKSCTPIFDTFYQLAITQFQEFKGKTPKHCYLMVNHIAAGRTKNGSGSGWHVDSVKKQYKTFMYLTDCQTQDLGPLTLLKSNAEWKERLQILLNYFYGNKFRFTDKAVNILEQKGFRQVPALFEKLQPFFADTSLIHRGAPITEGERIMITAYMFETDVPESISNRLKI